MTKHKWDSLTILFLHQKYLPVIERFNNLLCAGVHIVYLNIQFVAHHILPHPVLHHSIARNRQTNCGNQARDNLKTANSLIIEFNKTVLNKLCTNNNTLNKEQNALAIILDDCILLHYKERILKLFSYW